MPVPFPRVLSPDPADRDRERYQSGALLPGPGAILAGSTFQEWLDAAT